MKYLICALLFLASCSKPTSEFSGYWEANLSCTYFEYYPKLTIDNESRISGSFKDIYSYTNSIEGSTSSNLQNTFDMNLKDQHGVIIGKISGIIYNKKEMKGSFYIDDMSGLKTFNGNFKASKK